MAFQFNFSASISIPDGQIEAFQTAALKHAQAQPPGWLEDIVPNGFDPASLGDCARVLFGDPVGAFLDHDFEFDEAVSGLKSVEPVPDLKFSPVG